MGPGKRSKTPQAFSSFSFLPPKCGPLIYSRPSLLQGAWLSNEKRSKPPSLLILFPSQLNHAPLPCWWQCPAPISKKLGPILNGLGKQALQAILRVGNLIFRVGNLILRLGKLILRVGKLIVNQGFPLRSNPDGTRPEGA